MTSQNLYVPVVLEARHAYYRRCQQIRKTGCQCKAPALKGQHLCYAHQAQVEAHERRERFRRSLGLPPVLKPGPTVLRAMGQVIEAVINGRIDDRLARPLLIEMQRALSQDRLDNIRPGPDPQGIGITWNQLGISLGMSATKPFGILVDGYRDGGSQSPGSPQSP